jgi:hypothetical protein
MILLKPPHFTVLSRQVFISIPIAIFERLDTAILLEADSSIDEGSINFIGEVHVFAGTVL